MTADLDVLILVISVVALGLISGANTALEILSYSRMAKDSSERDSEVSVLDRLLEQPASTYLAVSMGRVVFIALLVIASIRFASKHLFDGQVAFSGSVFVIVVALGSSLFVPKLLALRNAERFMELTRPVIYPLLYVFKPPALLVVAAFKKFSPRALEAVSYQLLPLNRRIEMFGFKNGHQNRSEQKLMSSVLDFRDTKVREVMVPRIDMVAVNVNTATEDLLKQIVDAGHSRFPVYDESIDRIIGLVYTKDLLQKIVEGEEPRLGEIVRDVFFVPEGKKISDLLAEFRKRRKHMAIVVDEYGGTAGLITLEDVLEEIVGDIRDEFDAEEELIKRLGDESALCNAKVRLEDLNEALGVDLPENDADTLGGFLYEMIGRVPRVGDVVRRGDVEYEIHSVLRQRIDKVLIKGLATVDRRTGDNVR